jgi:hypothetical protein
MMATVGAAAAAEIGMGMKATGVVPPSWSRTAPSSSSAVERSSGRLARHRPSSSRKDQGTPSRFGSPCIAQKVVALRLSLSKGPRPVAANTMQPAQEKTSPAGPGL